jgi:DNA-binding transcriptional LysR family regulator
MKLDGITTFVAVAEAGSISEAARRLRLSKSVVSDRLNELERSLGAKLVRRSTRNLTLTEDGLAFLERASRIAHEIEEASADMAQRRGALVGPLRISAPVTFARMHLGPAIYPFLARHPGIELTLDLDDRRVDATADGYDAVVRHGPLADSRLMAWRLAPSRRVLIASPDYLARHGAPNSLADLNGHRGIFYTNRGVGDWRFLGPDGATIVRGRAALCVNNGDMMRDAALAGIGIALLPRFIVGTEIATGRLRIVDVGVQPESELIYVAHPDGRRPSAKLRAFADCLRDAFGDPPYWEQ